MLPQQQLFPFRVVVVGLSDAFPLVRILIEQLENSHYVDGRRFETWVPFVSYDDR